MLRIVNKGNIFNYSSSTHHKIEVIRYKNIGPGQLAFDASHQTEIFKLLTENDRRRRNQNGFHTQR